MKRAKDVFLWAVRVLEMPFLKIGQQRICLVGCSGLDSGLVVVGFARIPWSALYNRRTAKSEVGRDKKKFYVLAVPQPPKTNFVVFLPCTGPSGEVDYPKIKLERCIDGSIQSHWTCDFVELLCD